MPRAARSRAAAAKKPTRCVLTRCRVTDSAASRSRLIRPRMGWSGSTAQTASRRDLPRASGSWVVRTARQGDAQGPEVLLVDDADLGLRLASGRGRRLALDEEGAPTAPAREGQERRGTDRLHAGQVADPRRDLVDESLALRGVAVLVA